MLVVSSSWKETSTYPNIAIIIVIEWKLDIEKDKVKKQENKTK